MSDKTFERMNCCAIAPRKTLWQRLGFGYAHALRHPAPDGMHEGWLCSDVFVYLDWKDRLRVLMSGKLNVEVITFTELPAGKAISRSEVKVLAPTTPMETR